MDEKGCSGRRACDLFGISRTAQRYHRVIDDEQKDISEILIRLAESHKRWGFGLMFRWLRKNGYHWNHKRVYRIYCELSLNLRIKPKKRLPSRFPTPLHQPAEPNEVRDITSRWRQMYNGERPHSSLNDQTPWEFINKQA